MLSWNPVAVALINLAIATSRAGEIQRGDSCPSEETVGRKHVLGQALGRQERNACSKVSSEEEHLGHMGVVGSFHQGGGTQPGNIFPT